MNEITLSKDQQAGFETILRFLDDPDAKSLALIGHAGTGKSTLAQHVTRALGKAFMVAFTATTNKATKVLREMARDTDTPVDHVCTIYSLLGLVLTPDGNVKEVRRSGRGSSLADFDLVWLDEASMANEALMAHLDLDVASCRTKVIRMGDRLQLPPVGEEISRAFTGCDYTVELTEIVRQARDNPIIQLTSDIRESILKGTRTFNFETRKNGKGQGVYVLPERVWEQWMRAGFSSDAYKENGDAFRAVAWRNVAVHDWNASIRQALYKERAVERFLVGERVITASPIQDEEGTMVLAPTDSEGIIRSIAVTTHPYLKACGLGEYKVYHLAIGYEDVGLVDAFVMHEDSERAVDRKLSSLSEEARKDKKLWGTFWEFKDSFNDIRPAHAITSHRSQGSTYDNAFVDVRDIMRNSNWTEAMKSLYVACSRARNNLMLMV